MGVNGMAVTGEMSVARPTPREIKGAMEVLKRAVPGIFHTMCESCLQTWNDSLRIDVPVSKHAVPTTAVEGDGSYWSEASSSSSCLDEEFVPTVNCDRAEEYEENFPPISGTRQSPAQGARQSPVPGPRPSPVSGVGEFPVPGTRQSPGYGTRQSTVSGTRQSPFSGTRQSPFSGARQSPVSGTRPFPSSDYEPSSDTGTRQSPGGYLTPVDNPVTPASVPREYLLPVESPGSAMSVPRALSNVEKDEMRSRLMERQVFRTMQFYRGRRVNLTEGLVLYTNVFNFKEQQRLLEHVFDLEEKGSKKQLSGKTYALPQAWMRGKGRGVIQLGCFYNYNLSAPGIVGDAVVEDLTPPIKSVIRRLVRWGVLPEDCVPDSCIINIYEEGTCIPPHIDHHDFVRPFSTLSLLSESNILFGTKLSPASPGEFKDADIAIPLPVGSVLVLSGNGADVCKHAIPSVKRKRVSLTFRRMDPEKRPNNYKFPEDLKDCSLRS